MSHGPKRAQAAKLRLRTVSVDSHAIHWALSLDYHHHVERKTIKEQSHKQSRLIFPREIIFSFALVAAYIIVGQRRFKL